MITVTGQIDTWSGFGDGIVEVARKNPSLGNSIAQTVSKFNPVPVGFVGTNDTFGESGTHARLLEKYGLDAAHMVAATEKVTARKNK
jgi:transketolase C-terminal domain/subunit